MTVSQRKPTALKAIISMNTRKRLEYYVLAEPDPRTGICKAFTLKGGTTAVYFFPEFRDQDDDLIDANKRCRTWAALIMEATGKESDNDEDSEQDDGDDNKDKGKAEESAKQKSGRAKAKAKFKPSVRLPGTSNSAVASAGIGAGFGAGNSPGFQVLHKCFYCPCICSQPCRREPNRETQSWPCRLAFEDDSQTVQ